jgi:hypothetical protein
VGLAALVAAAMIASTHLEADASRVAMASARVAASAPVAVPEQWPSLEPGVWRVASTRQLPNGKTQRWDETIEHCSGRRDHLFMGYWGLGIVELAGCRYHSARVAPTEFKVTSECMVRRAGKVTSEAIVSVTASDAFELRVSVVEGKRKYAGTQTGRRTSACPGSSPAAGKAVP